jgi:hypothetical protein
MSLSVAANIAEVVSSLHALKVGQSVRRLFQSSGVGAYEVLIYRVELELLDACGKRAIYRKHQKLRFLQNDVVSYVDTLWGDGKIFEGYRTSYGFPVDAYQVGHRHRVLISFRETKNKGDEQGIHIEREIVDGFTQEFEALQTEIYHRVKYLEVSIIFPAERQPKIVRLMQSSKQQTLSQKYFHTIADGRMKVTWQTKYPRIHDTYTLRWQW